MIYDHETETYSGVYYWCAPGDENFALNFLMVLKKINLYA